MSPRVARAVVAAGVALSMLATGCHRSTAVGGAPFAPVSPSPSSSSGGGNGGGMAAVPGSGDDNLVTLDAKARSVETTAVATGLNSVHLSGPSVLTATGEVVDRNGRSLGTGSLRSDGVDVAVTSASGSLQLAAQLRLQPGLVTASGGAGVSFPGSATIASAHLTFQPSPPQPPSSPSSPAAPSPGSATTVASTTTVAPPTPVSGPVTLKATGLQVSGSGLRLVDAPADLAVSASEADLSWAGSGSIITSHGPLQAPYLGVRAQQLNATLRRTSGAVDVHGTGLVLQAYANGVPQLRTPARIDVLSSGATTGALGRRHAFVWTPRNLGNTYDMAILSVHPGNAAASGVHIGLRPMPAMFGGEPHALVGGDTAGLKGGDAIDSIVARHGDDKRSIGYDTRGGVPLVLIVQGNFDPLTVTVTTY